MSIHEDVQRDVERLLEMSVFVVSHPPRTGLTGEHCSSGAYLEIPLRWNATDDEYDRKLGETRIEITAEGHAALCAAIGECPHCGKAVAEGELH